LSDSMERSCKAATTQTESRCSASSSAPSMSRIGLAPSTADLSSVPCDAELPSVDECGLRPQFFEEDKFNKQEVHPYAEVLFGKDCGDYSTRWGGSKNNLDTAWSYYDALRRVVHEIQDEIKPMKQDITDIKEALGMLNDVDNKQNTEILKLTTDTDANTGNINANKVKVESLETTLNGTVTLLQEQIPKITVLEEQTHTLNVNIEATKTLLNEQIGIISNNTARIANLEVWMAAEQAATAAQKTQNEQFIKDIHTNADNIYTLNNDVNTLCR